MPWACKFMILHGKFIDTGIRTIRNTRIIGARGERAVGAPSFRVKIFFEDKPKRLQKVLKFCLLAGDEGGLVGTQLLIL